MTLSPSTLLTHARQVISVGPRPLSDRPVAHFLRKAIARGLLGVTLAAAGPLAAHDISSSHPELAGVNQSAMGSVSKDQATRPAFFVDTAFAKKAPGLSWVLPTGQVDGLELINQWKEGGVSPDQAFELISVLVWTQSPVIARTDEIAAQAIAQSQSTQSIFEISNAKQAEAFLSHNNRDELVLRGLLHSCEAQSALPSEDRTWENVANYWQIMSSDRLDETTSIPVPSKYEQNMDEAKERLLRAVDNSGLAGLRVPLANFNDSENIVAIAERLELANHELQQATGWKGPVLGLRGRVMLTVMSPLNISMAFPQQDNQFGMVSAWEDLGHEWLHVVDFALRTKPADMSITGGYTLTQQVLRSPAQNKVQQLWKDLPDRLRQASIKAGHVWYTERDDRVKKLAESADEDEQWKAGYVASRHETLAFAWQSHLQANAPSDSILSDFKGKINANDGVMGPKVEEDDVAAPIWKETMAELGKMWWQATPTLSEKLLERRQQALTASERSKGRHP